MPVAHNLPKAPITPAYVQSQGQAKPCLTKQTSVTRELPAHSMNWNKDSSIPSFKVVELDRLWTLRAGKPISHELIAWGDQAHWTVLWELPKDVVVPATATFYGTFQSAVTRVANTLAAEGLLLKEDIYESNNTVIIRAPGESK